LGRRLKVVGLVDPATERAASALAQKRDSVVVTTYQDTRTFKTFRDFVQQMTPKDRPRAVIIGSPPMFRGSTHASRDVELQILKELPGVALFIEKPVATGPEAEIQDLFAIAKVINSSATICSVGYAIYRLHGPLTFMIHRYMLRYLKAVQTMKRIIDSNNLTVMATIARYAAAYESIAKPDWWDKAKR
jgi:predicted dehydrogenase